MVWTTRIESWAGDSGRRVSSLGLKVLKVGHNGDASGDEIQKDQRHQLGVSDFVLVLFCLLRLPFLLFALSLFDEFLALLETLGLFGGVASEAFFSLLHNRLRFRDPLDVLNEHLLELELDHLSVVGLLSFKLVFSQLRDLVPNVFLLALHVVELLLESFLGFNENLVLRLPPVNLLPDSVHDLLDLGQVLRNLLLFVSQCGDFIAQLVDLSQSWSRRLYFFDLTQDTILTCTVHGGG